MEELKVQIVVGTHVEISEGRGETAVTHEQAAKIVGVSESTFRTLMLQGQIAAVGKVGKARVFRERDAIALRDRLQTT